MKILWLSAGLLPDACRALGRGVQVTGGWVDSQLQALLSNDGGENQYFMLSFDYRKCDIQLGRVHHRSFGEIRGITYGKSVPSFVEKQAHDAIKEFSPDVIHIHGSEYFYGRMNPSVYCGAPTIVSIQGILTPYTAVMTGNLVPHQMFWHQFNLKRFRYNSTVFNDQKYWERMRVPQEKLVFKSHKNFMGRTDWDRAWAFALQPEARYFHVNETLRAPFYTQTIRDEKKVVKHTIYCSAAAGYSLKGAHILFEAVSFLKRKYPDVQVRVCAAQKLNGRRSLSTILHDDQYGSYLRKLIRDLDIEQNVVGLPSLSAEEVAAELERAEVFVLPSFCENSPNSLGEAQLIGTPAIATYVGGTPSILRDGIDGRLVQAGDSAILAGAIDDYFLHPDLARTYACEARALAVMRHSPAFNAQDTMRAYEAIAGNKIT